MRIDSLFVEVAPSFIPCIGSVLSAVHCMRLHISVHSASIRFHGCLVGIRLVCHHPVACISSPSLADDPNDADSCADTRDTTLMGGLPSRFDRSDRLCVPRRLAAMYNVEWFPRARIYGHLYAVGYDGYRGIRERDVSHIHTHIFADRYAIL